MPGPSLIEHFGALDPSSTATATACLPACLP